MFASGLFYLLSGDFPKDYFDEGMWAKRIEEFRFSSISSLSQKMGEMKSKSEGFGPVFPNLNRHSLVHEIGNFYVLKYLVEQKKVPPETLKRRAKEFEEQHCKKMGLERLTKKEKAFCKEQVHRQLLRQVPEVQKCVYIVINRVNGWIFFDTSNFGTCENILALIRSAMTTLVVHPLNSLGDAERIFTDWIGDQSLMPAKLELGSSCELSDTDAAKASYKKQAILSDETECSIEAGKLVSAISLIYLPPDSASLSFTVTHDFKFSKIALQAELNDNEMPTSPSEGEEESAEQEAARKNAYFEAVLDLQLQSIDKLLFVSYQILKVNKPLEISFTKSSIGFEDVERKIEVSDSFDEGVEDQTPELSIVMNN